MKRIKNIINFLIFNIGFGLLIYVFTNHLEENSLAYISYMLSFYDLIIFCLWFYQVCKYSNEFIKKSKMYNLYQKKALVVTKITVFFSFIINLIYGIIKLGIGLYYQSWWFITFSIYHLLLCLVKLSFVQNINNLKKEYQKLKYTGIILLFLNFVWIGIIILIIKQDQIISYKSFLIYLIALYDFYLIIRAIINIIKHRKNHNPIVISSKCINLTVAMNSMISLEVAMIYQFGNNDSDFKLIMTSLMGVTIFLINSFMALYMILKAHRILKCPNIRKINV